MNSSSLALYGGSPVRTAPWPTWPRSDSRTEQTVLDVLRSGRWAISETSNGEELYERRFAEAFAAYHALPYCVPTTSGTSALTIAFEALGLRRGAEVLVPGLTWVACASAVAGVGLVPILVDIDPQNLCMSPDAAEAAITPATEAILLVHYGCCTADIAAFLDICRRHDLALVEDCAQAHGARYDGRVVGTFGDIGVYSMQESKVLTAGEGGAAVTADPRLYEAMAQYRADGRGYAASAPLPGMPNLDERGDVQGRNLCLSELQAAVLLGRLAQLDAENAHRQRMARVLDQLLDGIGSVTTISAPPRMTSRTYYRYFIRLDTDHRNAGESDAIRQELGAELGLLCEPVHDPLNACTLYNPLKSPHKYDPGILPQLDPQRFDLPEAHQARRELVTLPHRVLLGSERDMEDIATSVTKVLSNHSLGRTKSPISGSQP